MEVRDQRQRVRVARLPMNVRQRAGRSEIHSDTVRPSPMTRERLSGTTI